MLKLPPIEKIPEAYTAIEDDRIDMKENSASVKSSARDKEYTIMWQGNTYYSNDPSTYWQEYAGYPLIAILMLQNKLSLNRKISLYFKNINWNDLNKRYKKNYELSLKEVLKDIDEITKKEILKEMNIVNEELRKLDITITRKKIEKDK